MLKVARDGQGAHRRGHILCRRATPCTAATGAPAATITACISRPATTKESNIASRSKLQRFEPGTQGEHKVPARIRADLDELRAFHRRPRFAAAIRDFARREARGVDHYAAAVNEHVPYHRAPDEELQL